ncbi:MAG: penicillin-binding protein 1C [Pseudomonadota bacterium]
MKKLISNRVLFPAMMIVFLGISISSTWLFIASLPSPWRVPLEFSTKVTDRAGENLRFFTTREGFWRFPAQLVDIDKNFISALINYEDKRFFQHFGIDILALFRALKQFVFSSYVVSGASTLSMQTIRLLNPQSRTIKNKLLEMIQSIRMEWELSKEQILLLYLNLAPYGGNIQGIEAASYFYFGQSAKHFSPSEIALLIALPQSPERRRPDRHNQQARIARNKILQQQLANSLISEDEYQLAIQQAIKITRQKTPFYAPHLSQRLHMLYPGKQIIRSSIFLPIQMLLEQKIKQYRTNLSPQQTIAALVVDNKSNEVVAHMGSADFFDDSQIDLTRVIRSPGSTLKPFIYGLGFEKKLFHPLTRVIDRRFRYDDGYAPQNFDHYYRGQVTVETALLKSLNVPAVKALKRIGVNQFIQRLKSVGIKLFWQSGQEAGLGIALGGSGLSLESLVAMYTALANAGNYHDLIYTPQQLKAAKKTLLSPLASKYLDGILKKMPQGNQNKHETFYSKSVETVRYKTGTSYGYRDAWSIGYNSQYTIGIWVGRVDGGFTHNQTGSQIATPLLKQLFAIFPTTKQINNPLNSVSEKELISYQQLPQQMRWLGNTLYDNQNNLPYILYPLDGSLIEIKKIFSDDAVQLILKAGGGIAPYHWMIDGHYMNRPTQFTNNNEVQCSISRGKHKITLIDSTGKQSHAQIEVQIIKN